MKQIVVFGLGYVGLPLALALARHYEVIGYDTNRVKIDSYKKGIDPAGECCSEDFLLAADNISFSDDPTCLAVEKNVLVTVPTPVYEDNVPDLSFLKVASEILGGYLLRGDLIIYESTVFPGVTEEFCVPILENASGLVQLLDFNVGYSPERISPGDKHRKIGDIQKVISADSASALTVVQEIYEPIITAGLYSAGSIKVAEAAKALENTQRDINIALMNEMSLICEKIGINTYDVIDAASTKWNFLKFSPGLVGGHCIGVDPYYLMHKAEDLGYIPELILAGRRVNESMPLAVVQTVFKKFEEKGISPSEATVLVLGLTFKENVSDLRNSKVLDVVSGLLSAGVSVHTHDPYALDFKVANTHQLESFPRDGVYSCIVFAVAHDVFSNIAVDDVTGLLAAEGFIMDVKGAWRGLLSSELGRRYISL